MTAVMVERPVEAGQQNRDKPRENSLGAPVSRMTISSRLRFSILERDGYRCRYCGRSAPQVVLHVDHIHPRSKGGTDAEENLVTACEGCNLGKADRLLGKAPTQMRAGTPRKTKASSRIGDEVSVAPDCRCPQCGPRSELLRPHRAINAADSEPTWPREAGAYVAFYRCPSCDFEFWRDYRDDERIVLPHVDMCPDCKDEEGSRSLKMYPAIKESRGAGKGYVACYRCDLGHTWFTSYSDRMRMSKVEILEAAS